MNSYDFISVGGGAAGFFGAIACAAAAPEARVAILEGTGKTLTKVKVSGGGRCNVTTRCFEPKDLVRNYPRGGKALLSGFFKFGPRDMIAWLKERGVEVVGEPDGRMFPATNSSQTIIDCFRQEASRLGVEVLKGHLVSAISHGDDGFTVQTRKGKFKARRLLLATGSMPAGHKLARELGHRLTAMAPSLFTLKSTHPIVADMAGISMPRVKVTLSAGGRKFEQEGPLLFTHWGFSGPAILKLSAFAARELASENYAGTITVQWWPTTNREILLHQLQAMRQAEPRKQLTTTKFGEFPKRLWVRFVELCDLADTSWAEASDKKLRRLAEELVAGQYSFAGKGEFKEEFVTAGGVDLAEVNLQTYESKLVAGLYFAGEVLNVDGITGGFNFQNAWTTSWLAGNHAAVETRKNS